MIEENFTPKKEKGLLTFYLLSLVLMALISGGGVYLWQKSIDKPVIVSEEITCEEPTGWKVYKNEKYGFEFSYPDELSDIQEITREGETGFQFLIGYLSDRTKDGVDSDGFIVSGNSLDFTQGRSGWITDFQGYVNDNGVIKLRSSYGGPNNPKENLVELPKELIKNIHYNKNGVEIIMVNGKNYDNEMGGAVFGTAGEGRFNALINTNNSELPGLTFIAPVGYSEDDLLKIVSSIKTK